MTEPYKPGGPLLRLMDQIWDACSDPGGRPPRTADQRAHLVWAIVQGEIDAYSEALRLLGEERDGLRIRVAQLQAMRRAECPQAAPEDDCPCCTYGNHTEACRCDGTNCCHPERHRARVATAATPEAAP